MELTTKISDKKFEDVYDIIKNNNLSYNKLDKNDFIFAIENKEIIWFWRIYCIWDWNYELSSLWIDNNHRGNKIGHTIVNCLIQNKYHWTYLYTCTEEWLRDYYINLGFKLTKVYPDKFNDVLKFADSIWLEWIVMEYSM